jgi:putative ABC transport system ATP-binding protein
MSVIKAENIIKTYQTGKIEVKAVRGISLEIEQGEFTALVGSSGCGKTTLLNILNGLDNPTSGNVFLSGKNLNDMSEKELSDFRRDHVGFIFQSYNLIPVLSVKENIEYVMTLQGVSKRERNERVAEILEIVGLEDMKDRFPAEMSGGQQQRVAVARAVVTKPDIILADEPTANLDSETGAILLDMMKDLNEKLGTTFLFATHDSLVMDRVKRLVRLKDGKIIEDTKKNN